MEESSTGSLRWWLFGGAVVILIVFFVYPRFFGGGSGPSQQPLTKDDWGTVFDGERADPETCQLVGTRSSVTLTSRGGAVSSAVMTDPKYATSVDKPDTRIDLVTTSKEQRMPLRASLRAPKTADDEQQVEFDNLDMKLTEQTATSCTFELSTATAKVKKVVSLTDRPFELSVVTSITNLADTPKKHRFAIEQDSWRSEKETKSSFWDLGRRPEWLTEVVTHTDKDTKRHLQGDFEPKDFKAEDGYTDEHFLQAKGTGVWAAVSTNYFAASVIHQDGPAPSAEVLIEDGAYYNVPEEHPNHGRMYRARLSYPTETLRTGETATYSVLAFMGPKERAVLAAVGGSSDKIKMSEVIDLGMFGILGRMFVGYVAWLFSMVKSWGWAICLLTMTVKIAVFPLQLPSLKTSVAMRRLKPDIDKINEQYKDDMMQKNLAMQELYRREGVRNPALGCIPVLLQMPVWIALYQALGTSVELFHTPFGPLIPDLTHSDPYHVIPIVLGGSSFLQQKLMPAQGMDPAQAKMMLYLMPGIFTAMMFFLPAGLGVYMLTNTWLGIGQQFLVERWVRSQLKDQQGRSIQVRDVTDAKDAKQEDTALRKGKVRARG
ncbi:MAG: membrane protein insertase YidC [Polyangiaceae bacterium]